MKNLFRGFALGAAMTVVSVGAQAAPIGLGIVIDESGSIGSANFELQRNAYINAFTSILPTNGSVAVGLWTFDTSATQHFSFKVVDDTDLDLTNDLADLIAAIVAMPYNGGGTNIQVGINAAASAMAAFGYGNLDRAVIDVSTDGFGGDPVTAANNFVADATANTLLGRGTVNCLGIGAGANCNFEAGYNAFEILSTFDNLETALIQKIGRELEVPVPAPGALSLLGLGLLGFGAARRKRV